MHPGILTKSLSIRTRGREVCLSCINIWLVTISGMAVLFLSHLRQRTSVVP